MDYTKTGKVKFFSPSKGFGLITEDASKEDIYVSVALMERAGGVVPLYEGQSVSFIIATQGSKKAAVYVSPLEDQFIPKTDVSLNQAPFSPSIIETVQYCTTELVNYLKKDPESLNSIHPKVFEDLVARIFENEGFVVEFNKAWNQADGGVDIIAIRTQGAVPYRLAIQCKRYARGNHVTAEPIRSLAGVLDRFKAHAGVLATSSFFTGPAIEETRNHFWKIHLHDYDQIVASLMKLNLGVSERRE